MAKSVNPSTLTRANLTERGFVFDEGERWIPRTNIRKDLFGCGDFLAAKPVDPERVATAILSAAFNLPPPDIEGIFLVQTTSGANHASRKKKILGLLESNETGLKGWCAAGGRILLQSWRKSAKTGEWVLREEEI